MQVIDEKGRIGGKINIIDLLVILVILAALIAVAVFLGRGAVGGGEAEHIIYTVEVQGVDEDVYRDIQTKLPSQLLASDALQDGYVTKVEGTRVEENDQASRGAAPRQSPGSKGSVSWQRIHGSAKTALRATYLKGFA